MGATALIARLRNIGLHAEADLVTVVWKAIQTHPQGGLGLLEFAGTLGEAAHHLEEYHRRQKLLDE